MESMADYCKRRGITVEVVRDRGTQVEGDGERAWEHHAYVLRLTCEGRTLETPWRQGLGVEDSPEDRPDMILDSLVRDAAAGAEGLTWEDFADEYGYDTDSLSAYRTWEACRSTYMPLCAFLGGADEYERVTENVDAL